MKNHFKFRDFFLIQLSLFFFLQHFFAQAQSIQSLEEKIDSLWVLADQPIGSLEQIDSRAKELYSLAQQVGFETGIQEALYHQGYVMSKSEELDSALLIFESLQQYSSLSKYLQARVDMMIGYTNHLKGNYQLALEFYLKANNSFEELKKWGNYYRTVNNMGRLNMILGNPEKAFQYYQEVFNHRRFIRKIDLARLYNAFGTFYSHGKKLDSAYHFYKQALILHQQLKDQRGEAHGFNNLAIVAYQQGKVEQAIEGFKSALAVRLNLGNESNISDSYYNIGYLYADRGNHFKALNNYRKGLHHARKANSEVAIKDVMLELATTFKNIGKFDSAHFYLSEGKILADKLLNEAKQKEILALEKQFNTQRLKKEKALIEEENQIKTIQRNGLLVGLLMLVMFAAIGHYIVRLRFQKNLLLAERDKAVLEKENELVQKEVELKKEEVANYANQLIHKNEILEELRNRLEEHQSIEDKISTLDYQRISEKFSPHLTDEKDWLQFKLQFENAYPTFFANLQAQSADLTSNDQRLASLIKINLSNKEVGQILNISPDSVVKAKYRLRQKLGFQSNPELENFLRNA